MSNQNNSYDAFLTCVLPLQELGKSATGNSGFTAMLAKAISKIGKPVHELTVGEAQRICHEIAARYNQIYS